MNTNIENNSFLLLSAHRKKYLSQNEEALASELLPSTCQNALNCTPSWPSGNRMSKKSLIGSVS